MENVGGEGVVGVDVIDDIWNGDCFCFVFGCWYIDVCVEFVLVGMVD